MKNIYLLLTLIIPWGGLKSQDLPHHLSPEEKQMMPAFLRGTNGIPTGEKSVFSPPSGNGLRSMAEWEEVSALIITWTSYTSVLREIVRNSVNECLVYIQCSDSNSVKTSLTSGGVPLANVRYIQAPYNSVWCRDYSANSVYINQVDSLILVDWKYNRPARPSDDTLPRAISRYTGLALYEMSASPYTLIATGGNYMSDGFGTAMASQLIDQENTALTAAQIDSISKNFLGIQRYIRYTTLPNDGIHHIDMHMKLLDEETLLVGQYPTGVSDGPQIESNIQYLLSNFNSVFGTPYKIVRIPMPPDSVYLDYPPASSYFTYTNGVFINKTFIFPSYYTQYDTTALRIYKENLPGYHIVPINCNATIPASGAIHCITHSVGSYNPLLISLQRLPDTYNTTSAYPVSVRIMNKSGIQNATLYYRTDTLQPFTALSMSLSNAAQHVWTAYIPPQSAGNTVHYYVKGLATNGKEQVRPITAPTGSFSFKVLSVNNIEERNPNILQAIYPNPAGGITCIPVENSHPQQVSICLYSIYGQKISTLFEGNLARGKQNFFLQAGDFPSGTYLVIVETESSRQLQKLLIK